MTKLKTLPTTVWAVPGLFLLLNACGDGNNDTLLTGFSGVIIFIIVVWLIVHFLRKGD